MDLPYEPSSALPTQKKPLQWKFPADMRLRYQDAAREYASGLHYYQIGEERLARHYFNRSTRLLGKHVEDSDFDLLTLRTLLGEELKGAEMDARLWATRNNTQWLWYTVGKETLVPPDLPVWARGGPQMVPNMEFVKDLPEENLHDTWERRIQYDPERGAVRQARGPRLRKPIKAKRVRFEGQDRRDELAPPIEAQDPTHAVPPRKRHTREPPEMLDIHEPVRRNLDFGE